MTEIVKYKYIDALRGIAILMVIMIHTSHHVPQLSKSASFLASKGLYGVQLFFIASALTLFLSFEQRMKKDGNNTIKFFLIRRLFRITPAYYLAIVLYSLFKVVMPWTTFPNSVNGWHIITSFLYINSLWPGAINYVPPGGWSVAIEMIFYLLIPFMFLRIHSLSKSVLLFFGALIFRFVCNAMGGYLMGHFTSLDPVYHKVFYFYYWLPNQLPVFFLGIVLYNLLKTQNHISRQLGTVLICVAVAAIFSTFYIIKYYDWQYTPEFIIVAICFSFIIYSMSSHVYPLLQNAFTTALGKVSFSMYLWHFIILDLFRFVIKRMLPVAPEIQFLVLYVSAVAATFYLSVMTYNRIELAGVEWGRKVIARSLLRDHNYNQ